MTTDPYLKTDLYDVAIVGYGPAGETLANLLGQAGKKVIVFEKEESVYHAPRASHLDGEVMRIYQSIGLAEKIEKVTIGAKGYHFLNAEGRLLTELVRRDGKGPHGWNHHYRFHQPVLEGLLRKGAERFGNVHVHLCHEVTRIEQNEHHSAILAKNRKDGTTRETKALYTIGCDGARSTVAKWMGTVKRDVGLHEPWLVVDIKLKRQVNLPNTGIQYCEPARPTTFIPYVGARDRFRWEMKVLPGETKEELEEPERVWELLSRWLTPEDAELERAAVYMFHSTITERWRNNRLFLAGDAAHQMPPFLGQGMCAGIRDVANLSWKLAINTPNNPTGYTLSLDEMTAIAEIARENHIHVFCDEVYKGLEFDGNRLPWFADVYENAVSLGVMSKAYGLSGLRIGWIGTQNKEIYDKMIGFKNYTSICSSAPSEFLSMVALSQL
ncbi:bifunctional 3-(3-hydroxy-phenyl)propionate/3-hydroxycinnamic acid hydroxylase [Brevibacillus sp. NRS-1366]|uniref:bifunctional 3-(3-hydroxy-phenyl)propionate/3-hydroxycinnamic acid hydroxylase n=1 Tax=Brevibacillus sp. NRS-1366 TaxID=3233899 RepID=UPI003D24E5B0